MTTLDTFNAFFEDVMNQKMSVHAFGMFAKGHITLLELEYQQLKEESETTNGDLTALVNRAFLIMNDNKFFECNERGEWYSSLHTTMVKAITKRKFTDLYSMQNIVIEALKNEIKELKQPTMLLTCEWVVNDPNFNTYKTGCGQYFTLIEGNLKDSNVKYYSYCGGIIEEPKVSE